MVSLRVQILSLLVGNVLSWDHQSLIGAGNLGTDRLDAESFGDIFDEFTLTVPVPPPPTMGPTPSPVNPTNSPTKRPTPFPVISPTRPPIPAGRFPTPVVEPTLRPARPPTVAPIPIGRWPRPPTPHNIQHPPIFVPHPDSNIHSDEPDHVHVPEHEHEHDHDHDPEPDHAHEPENAPPKLQTRIANFEAEWGFEVNSCQQDPPNVLLNCHEGGVIGLKNSENAECSQVGNDRMKCKQLDLDIDSSVHFSCSGIRNVHLMSTATVGPNIVSGCTRDGNAVKYLTLSRECSDHVDTNPACNGGLPWRQGDTSYCASPSTCQGQDICSDIKLEPITMSNKNSDLRCSHVNSDLDLQFHSFDESYISSISTIDWRISGEKRGCSWNSPPLQIECENGGRLEFEEDYPFCSIRPEDSMGLCTSFAPYSVESEESVSLIVRCIGQSESQLNLSIEIPSTTIDLECTFEGTIIESLMLARGCGEMETDEFKLVNHPSFCDGDDQVFTTDDDRTYCFVGNTCLSDDGCNNMQLPYLSANNGIGRSGDCIYVM